MNVSMQDTFNLGWKLASVVQGTLHPRILETYQQERLPVAERLIALDQRICRGMRSRRNTGGEKNHCRFDEDHKRAFEEENSSASGLAVIYQPNLLVTPTILRAAGAEPPNNTWHPAVASPLWRKTSGSGRGFQAC